MKRQIPQNKTCPCCGVVFLAMRPNQKYPDSKHRNAFNNRKQRESADLVKRRIESIIRQDRIAAGQYLKNDTVIIPVDQFLRFGIDPTASVERYYDGLQLMAFCFNNYYYTRVWENHYKLNKK